MKIFRKVHCKAYLKKISDGVRLDCFFVDKDTNWMSPAEGTSWTSSNVQVKAMKTWYENGMWKDKEIADLSAFEGETVEKVYRERIEEEFDGFLVGITSVITTGRIGTDMDMRPYNMNGDLEEIYHLMKETDQQKVGVVYFKNNAKRYVLIEDME